MRIFLTLLGMLFALPAKVYYCQVVFTAPVSQDIAKADDLYVYKGDSLDIVYSFWADGGVMAFMTINKSNSPLYIDWTHSCYHDSKVNLVYYPVDRTGNNISEANNIYKTPQDWYRLFAPFIRSGYVSVEGGGVEEPVTVMPPQSYMIKTCYRILPQTVFSVKKLTPSQIPFISGMRDSYPGWVMNADTLNKEVVFDNEIYYNTQKDFANAKHIDNKFYVWKVLTFEEGYLEQYDPDNNSLNCPYHSNKKFLKMHLKISDFD